MESAMSAANLSTTLKTTSGRQRAQNLAPDVLAKLRTVATLASLKDEELNCLEGLEEIHLAEGDLLYQQGDTAQFFYILLDGKLSMFQTSPAGHTVYQVYLTPGTTFGEVPL